MSIQNVIVCMYWLLGFILFIQPGRKWFVRLSGYSHHKYDGHAMKFVRLVSLYYNTYFYRGEYKIMSVCPSHQAIRTAP